MLSTVAFWLALALGCRAAAISEDFAKDPAQHGWRGVGDTSLFRWNPTNQNLEVTWDSSHTNSFFYLPLGTVLTESDDFTFSFDVRLFDIRLGNTPGKTNTFEIAIGLLNYHSATNSKAFRGAGESSTYGVRNIVEFDYFPDAGLGDTFATTVISTNNVIYFPFKILTLSLSDTFGITITYAASNQVLRTSIIRNGSPFDSLPEFSLTGAHDFRVDAFGISSYSDAIQIGPPAYYGSVLAHGVVDNVQLVVPTAPLSNLHLRQSNSVWLVEFISQTNWLYTLERSLDCSTWAASAPSVQGSGGTVRVTDTNASVGRMFYRVRAERP